MDTCKVILLDVKGIAVWTVIRGGNTGQRTYTRHFNGSRKIDTDRHRKHNIIGTLN